MNTMAHAHRYEVPADAPTSIRQNGPQEPVCVVEATGTAYIYVLADDIECTTTEQQTFSDRMNSSFAPPLDLNKCALAESASFLHGPLHRGAAPLCSPVRISGLSCPIVTRLANAKCSSAFRYLIPKEELQSAWWKTRSGNKITEHYYQRLLLCQRTDKHKKTSGRCKQLCSTWHQSAHYLGVTK